MPGLDELLSILDLEVLERNLFRGHQPKEDRNRVYGGQVVAQSLVAAYRTVEARPVHSLHAYFIRPGNPAMPIVYQVDRLRDGRSFSVRRVLAVQDGEAIFSMGCSFQPPEEGIEHQLVMPSVPHPDELPSADDVMKAFGRNIPSVVERLLRMELPIEFKPVDFEGMMARKMTGDSRHVWMRARAPLPDDPIVHHAVLAHASDMAILDVALHKHGFGLFDGRFQSASLDHAMWFHRPFRMDEWLLYSHESPSMSSSRGFAEGSIFTEGGRLVASVAQEGLLRRRAP